MTWKDRKVGVLMGGVSREREVSLTSGRAVAAALIRRGYDVTAIDADFSLVTTLQKNPIDVAFIALHGKYGEDGCVQGLLEWMKIPYTGSGVKASAMAMDKVVTKEIAKSLGILIPDGTTAPSVGKNLKFPVIVKPSCEGSTIHVTVVTKADDLQRAITCAGESDTTVLIEQYIQGREVTVGLLEGKSLPIIEIVPKKGLYDYESKYTKGMTEYRVPASLDSSVAKQLSQASEKIFSALGCSGFARADFMISEEGRPYFLEINTIPGFTDLSLVPMAAKVAGISFDDLCERILNGATLRGGA